MKKVLAVVCMAAFLVVAVSLPVCAATNYQNDLFHLRGFKVLYGSLLTNAEWESRDAVWDPSNARLYQSGSSADSGYGFYGFYADFYTAAYVKVDSGSYFNFSIEMAGGYNPQDTNADSYYIHCTIVDSNDITYDLTPYLAFSGGIYTCNFAGKIGDGQELYIKSVIFESNIPSLVTSGIYSPYDLSLNFSLSWELTEEQRQHEELLDSIEANTDKITNGWQTEDDTSGEIDSVTGDMEQAENEALGGKSDEEIQAEVDGVLSNENTPSVDHTGVIGVAGLFDKCLTAFGQDYQSVLVLSLTLGFAAFLVGRQYRAKGD